MKSKVVAIFDFDGTITKGDTFLPFLFFTFGFWKTFFCLIYTSPFTVAYIFNLVSNHYAKEKMIHFLFRNTDVGELTLFSEMFIEKKLNKYLRQNIIDRLNWHQKNKHITVLISASLDIYIEPWARKFNFSFVESTVLGKYKNLCTGK